MTATCPERVWRGSEHSGHYEPCVRAPGAGRLCEVHALAHARCAEARTRQAREGAS